VRLYDRLFVKANPLAGSADFREHLNPASLETLSSCQLEPSLAGVEPGSRYQFERQGYFCVDAVDSSESALVFNRTVALRDSWAKIEKRQRQEGQR
jgi:glutaminyl-tRNA synthetase